MGCRARISHLRTESFAWAPTCRAIRPARPVPVRSVGCARKLRTRPTNGKNPDQAAGVSRRMAKPLHRPPAFQTIFTAFDGHREVVAPPLGHMRWKISVPRTLVRRPFGATYVTIPVAATVVGLTKRPDQTVVALQSGVQFLDVWNATRGPRTRPTRS